LLQRAFLRTEAQRPVQQQSFGGTHLPDRGFDRVPAQLLERGDALVAIDHQITVAVLWGPDHHDGRLLAGLSQGGQQAPLEVRLADS
jgi:hypothetical protein